LEPRTSGCGARLDSTARRRAGGEKQVEEIRRTPVPPKRPGPDKLAQNIQEAFLNNARKEKIFLTIYLMSGVKLSGRIRSFDKYSVVLESNNQEQLIFKHAISTVVVSRPMHGGAYHGLAAAGAPGPPPGPAPPEAAES
jgi:host factor-I protein